MTPSYLHKTDSFETIGRQAGRQAGTQTVRKPETKRSLSLLQDRQTDRWTDGKHLQKNLIETMEQLSGGEIYNLFDGGSVFAYEKLSTQSTHCKTTHVLENKEYKLTALFLKGDNSVSLRRIWSKLAGYSSYKPPGASYTAQGPQKQPETLNTYFILFDKFQQQIKLSFIFPYIPFFKHVLKTSLYEAW